jgi:hypothetical protein
MAKARGAGLQRLPEWVGALSEGLGRTSALTGARVSMALMLPELRRAEKKVNADSRYSASPRQPSKCCVAQCAARPQTRKGADRARSLGPEAPR